MNIPNDPQQLLALSHSFMECRVLLTGAELDIFGHLESPVSCRQLARRQGWHERPLAMLLDALAAMGVVVKKDGLYRTAPNLMPFLSSNSPRSVLPMIRHSATIWKSWSDLTRIVAETGAPEGRSPLYENPVDRKAFIDAMHVVARERAPEIAKAIDQGSARRLIDVGGGSGTYTIAFLEAFPDMSATLFDLPEVAQMARGRLEEAGLMSRVSIVPGDYKKDPLPPGHDLALLSAIIHSNSPEQNVELYRKIFDALEPGGRIVIRDHIMSPDRTVPKSGALFAINMLVGTPGGGTYTYDEIRAGLAAAGFDRVELVQDKDQMMGLVQAYKP